jgi:hypothetical protein
MTDRDLLVSIHAKVDELAEAFATHLGEHNQLTRGRGSMLAVVSAITACVSTTVAIVALWLR